MYILLKFFQTGILSIPAFWIMVAKRMPFVIGSSPAAGQLLVSK